MATCDHPSELICQLGTLRLGSGVRTAASEKWEKDLASRARVQRNDADHIFYFIEPRPRNPWAAIGSLAFLSALVAATIVIPLLHTDPLPKRETLTVLYLQPPAAAAGGNARTFEAPRPRQTFTPTSNAIPSPVHKTQEAPTTPVATGDGVVGGVPGGIVGGIPGGVLGEVLTKTPSVPVVAKTSEPAPVKRIRVAARVVEANLIHDVPPQYPTEAGRARIEGTVVLMAVIDRDGHVKDVRVESGLAVLAQAAIDAVKQWRYKPYMIDGEPVEVDSRITINFTLSAT